MKHFHLVTDKIEIFFHLVGGWHILSNAASNYLLQFSQSNNNNMKKQHLAREILLRWVFYFSIK